MRLVVKYTKEEKVKYISHLDFIRLAQRALRRADIPVAYSQGFNPHPKVSFASALAVGVTSEGEYMDIYLDREMDADLLCSRMNEKLPEGIRFVDCVEIDEKHPSLMIIIERASYLISLSSQPFDQYDIIALIDEFLSQSEILITRTNRKGNRIVDIREMIHSIDIVDQSIGRIDLKVVISTGSKANLRPEQLVGALFDFTNISLNPGFILKIHRLGLYLFKDGRWITPIEIG